MPYTGARGLGETEWREYRARLELHLKCHPEYDAGWRRPAEATAKRVWKSLVPAMRLRLGELVPDHDWLEPDESDALAGPVERPLPRSAQPHARRELWARRVASSDCASGWKRATTSRSRGTTRRGGARRSTRPEWSTRPRARRAPGGSARPGTQRSGRAANECVRAPRTRACQLQSSRHRRVPPGASPVRRVGRRCRRGMDLDDLYVWRGHEPNAGARTPPLGQVC